MTGAIGIVAVVLMAIGTTVMAMVFFRAKEENKKLREVVTNIANQQNQIKELRMKMRDHG